MHTTVYAILVSFLALERFLPYAYEAEERVYNFTAPRAFSTPPRAVHDSTLSARVPAHGLVDGLIVSTCPPAHSTVRLQARFPPGFSSVLLGPEGLR